ncbi:MAG: protein kinase [Renibacterium sp.]|nr:protein kinase [Renibacterium sp.]
METSFPPGIPIAPGYRFERLLGAGASAQVWLVLGDAGVERAIKCFPAAAWPAGATAPGGRAGQLRREIRIRVNVQHEHLLAVHDVVKLTGAWVGGTGLLMDYAAGGSLAAVLANRGRISPGELVTVLVPMFQVLAFLHRQGIVHGDVSAANVLFTETGKPLLADFGTAKLRGDRSDGELFGTDGFVDPALLRPAGGAGRLAVDAAADVYALSALGWWCLSGALPGPANPRFPMPGGVPTAGSAELFGLLASGMDPERRRRPAAGDLARELFRSATAEPLDLMPSVHPSVLPRLLTRRQLRGGQASSLPTAAAVRAADAPASTTPAGRNASGRPGGSRRRNRSFRWARSSRGGRRRVGLPWVGLPRPDLRRSGLPGRAVALFALLGGISWLLAVLPGQGPPGETTPVPAQQNPAQQNPAERRLDQAAPSAEDAAALRLSGDPVLALHGLSRLRAEAFRTADASLLAAVNAPDSPASAADRQTMAELVSRSRVLAGFSATVRAAAVQAGDATPDPVVSATVELSPFVEQDAAGTVFNRQPASRLQVLNFRMVNQSGRWLIAEVRNAG